MYTLDLYSTQLLKQKLKFATKHEPENPTHSQFWCSPTFLTQTARTKWKWKANCIFSISLQNLSEKLTTKKEKIETIGHPNHRFKKLNWVKTLSI